MIFIEEKIAVLLEKYGNGCGKSGIPGGKFSFFPQDEKDGISFIFQRRAHVHKYGESSAHARKRGEIDEGTHDDSGRYFVLIERKD